MFRLNARHLQMPIISSITELPESYRERLGASWAGTFYREFFVRIDEDPFAVLYSDKASRPNIPVNRLVSLEFLKAGQGWSDEEMYDALRSNLQVRYATYPMLVRVFGEHFVMQATAVTVKPGQEISVASLQAPDDAEATYRSIAGEPHKGYVANVTETCHPENPVQLIVKVQTAANTTDDGTLLAAAVPASAARTDLDELHTDGGYNGPAADAATAAHGVRHIQTATRGGQPTGTPVPLAEFGIVPVDTGTPQTLTCPQGQRAPVSPGLSRRYPGVIIRQRPTCCA